jgi:uncharacterized phiE125 gp8 family phage protein
MPAVLIQPPAAEPIARAELEAHLRLDAGAESAVLDRLIGVARAQVETTTRRCLVTQRWRVFLDRWPHARRVALPVAPVQQVLAVTVYDAAGTPRSLDPADFLLDRGRAPPTLTPKGAAPGPARAANGIEIDVEAGYGPPAAVPAPLREAVLRLAARWAEHRLDAETAELSGLPPLVQALVAPYRVMG